MVNSKSFFFFRKCSHKLNRWRLETVLSAYTVLLGFDDIRYDEVVCCCCAKKKGELLPELHTQYDNTKRRLMAKCRGVSFCVYVYVYTGFFVKEKGSFSTHTQKKNLLQCLLKQQEKNM